MTLKNGLVQFLVLFLPACGYLLVSDETGFCVYTEKTQNHRNDDVKSFVNVTFIGNFFCQSIGT